MSVEVVPVGSTRWSIVVPCGPISLTEREALQETPCGLEVLVSNFPSDQSIGKSEDGRFLSLWVLMGRQTLNESNSQYTHYQLFDAF